jgi:hypothetical protein
MLLTVTYSPFVRHRWLNDLNDWQRSLERLSKLEGVKFYAHQLRDSFAVDLLSNGLSLYAPWVKSRADFARKID